MRFFALSVLFLMRFVIYSYCKRDEVNLFFRNRLETAQEQWERLTGSLREHIYWIETQERLQLAEQQPLGCDMEHLKKQSEFITVAFSYYAICKYLMKGTVVLSILRLSCCQKSTNLHFV